MLWVINNRKKKKTTNSIFRVIKNNQHHMITDTKHNQSHKTSAEFKIKQNYPCYGSLKAERKKRKLIIYSVS